MIEIKTKEGISKFNDGKKDSPDQIRSYGRSTIFIRISGSDDMAHLRESFGNLPTPIVCRPTITYHEITYYGDMAKFIVGNW